MKIHGRIGRMKSRAKSALSAVMSFVLAASIALSPVGTIPAQAQASSLPDTITGKAYIYITNRAATEGAGSNGIAATAQCSATIYLPDGSVAHASGHCISGNAYAAPYDGTYDYVGTLNSEGTYDIVIDSSVSAPANAGTFLPGAMKGTQKMGGMRVTYNPTGYLTLHKASSNPSLTEGNGCYSLAGAVYGVYSDAGCTNEVATLTTDGNGDANTVELKAGTYYVKEKSAPSGFYIDTQAHGVTVTSRNTETLQVSDNPAADPMFMLLGKFDGEKTYNGEGNLPQGSASLADAEYTVDYYATLDYNNYEELQSANVKPTRSWIFKTDSNGFSGFDTTHFVSGDAFYYGLDNSPSLPRGIVTIRETKAPIGYIKSDDVSFQKIQQDNSVEGVLTYNAPKVAEQINRSDIEFTKKAENGSAPLAGVPFKITSLTTGESHIVVTDANGYFSSASSWNAHDSKTNANDWALDSEDAIDSGKLDASAGCWFGKNSVADESGEVSDGDAIAPDNSRGAFPFDTYSIEELRCTANEGYALIETTVTITKDAKTIDLGTFDDPEPELSTTAYDAADSDHYVGVGSVKVMDKVDYSHLVAGKTYTVSGELHDAVTGDAITVGGQNVTSAQTFVAEDASGSVTLEYAFDAYDLAGKTLVVYETLCDQKGAKLAEHKDKADVSQQVTVLTPEIQTTASDGADGDKYIVAEGDATVVDTVRYTGLTAGQTYTVTGTLMDKESGKALTDANGDAVTAKATFTAASDSGNASVTFTFDASELNTGTKLVAFETLSLNGIELCSHADIEDVDQTVYVKSPVITTVAVDSADGDKFVTGEEGVSIRDQVHYSNVTPGKTYTVTGTLMSKSTKKAITDADGNPVTSQATFTAEDTYGDTFVTFYFDGSNLRENAQLVAFETLSYNGKELASHNDLADANQTVTITKPKLSTKAVDGADGNKNLIGEDDASIVDTVHYVSVTPGKTYTVTGTLMDKATGKAVTDADGNEVTAKRDFIPETSTGDVDVTFTFDASNFKVKDSLVVYESLSLNGKELASHKDMEDKDQTVTVIKPKISTTALDGADKDKNLIGEGDAVIVDTVKYKDVTPGKTYTVTGTLYKKVTDKDGNAAKEPLKGSNGNAVTATSEFTPDDTYGTVDVTFTFDAASLSSGEEVVVFETLSYNGKELATHSDIEDADQTVTVTKPELSTSASDGADGDKNVVSEDEAVIVDTVKYKNVTPGKTYTITGTLYMKATDEDGNVSKELLTDANGNAVTATSEFTPDDTYGTADVTFTFDATDIPDNTPVVVFETISYNGKELSSHADIEDADQTVLITPPELATIAEDGLDGDKNVVTDTEVTVVDTVKYKNVTPGKTYTVTGTLYQKVTDEDGNVSEEKLLDAFGNEITSQATFTAKDSEGEVLVTFTFDGSLLADETPVVAFESLSYNEKEIAAHADIEDEDQTVTMHTPKVATTATDTLDGDKVVLADAESSVTDEIAYDHVIPGKTYTMAGMLMDADTGLPILTKDGAQKYTKDDLESFVSGLLETLGFTPTTYAIELNGETWGDGSAIVKNEDGSYSCEVTMVVENADGTTRDASELQTLIPQEDGTWLLKHAFAVAQSESDEDAAVAVPADSTLYTADEVAVTETVVDWSCMEQLPTASIDLAKLNAYIGEHADMLSYLVVQTATFAPEKESDAISMDFGFNANDVIDRLSGETKNLVAFELLIKGDLANADGDAAASIVAAECDKDSEDQTVTLSPSSIRTTATDKSDGDHALMAGKDAVITDEVAYEGLIPGKEYTLHATLMDKATGEPLKVADKGVTAELKFTPNSQNGTVSIDLGEFDATSLSGHTLVVFEELTKQSEIDEEAKTVTVAEHKDINDEGQSVTVTDVPNGSTYGKTGIDLTNVAIAIGILLMLAGGALLYAMKTRKASETETDGAKGEELDS